MGFNDHIDWDLHYAITDLVDEGYIEDKSPAYGVAQQVIHSGYDSLSQKQRILYDSVVVPALSERGEEIKMIHITNSAQD
ncbi:MAG: hypothetical protein AAGU21_17975 [Solidesulfovibrio sp.]|uniref:hypothetical protein n=1 Tax=Solidesulfovibrio sp. TaxID=2910990 RepID=UPI0031580B96